MTNYNLLYFDRSWLLIAVWQLALNRVSRFIQGVLSGITDQLRHFSKIGEFIVPAKSLTMLASTTYASGTGTSLSFTHTVNSGTDCLIVCAYAQVGGINMASATCGGQPMDYSITQTAEASSRRAWMIFLKNPPAGAQTITLTFSGSSSSNHAFATNWMGTQAVPLRTAASSTSNGTTSASTAATSAIGDIVIDLCSTYYTNTPSMGQTVLSSGGLMAVSTKPGAAGTTTLGWTWPTSGSVIHIVAAIKGS